MVDGWYQVAELLREGDLGWQIAAGGGGMAVSAAALGALLLKPVRERVLPRPGRTRLTDVVSLGRILADGRTLRLPSGRLVVALAIQGVDRTALSASAREELYHRLRGFFLALQERPEVEVRVLSLRRRAVMSMPTGWHDLPVVQSLMDRYLEGFVDAFTNDHYLVLSVRPQVPQARERLAEVVSSAMADLQDFGPQVLERGTEEFSPLLSFWARVLTPGDDGHVGADFGDDVTAAVVGRHVHFRPDGVMEFRDGPDVVYGAALSVPKWGEETHAAMMSALLGVPVEVTVLQTVRPYAVLEAQARVQAKRRWKLGGVLDRTGGITQQFDEAEALLQPGQDHRESQLAYEATVFVYARDPADLEDHIQQIRQATRPFGARLVRLSLGGAERRWLAQVPGRLEWLHAQDFWSANVAQLASFESPATGFARSDWCDEPYLLMRQVSGTPYSFQFHVSPEPEEVGHTAIFGPTGSGKTLLVNMLIAAGLRFPGLTWYRFDRDQQAWPFVQALGSWGEYLALQTHVAGEDEALSINPFQMPLTAENKAFLHRWLRALSGAPAEAAETNEEIARFVSALERVPLARRSLAELHRTVFTRGGPVEEGLRPWADPEVFGGYINAEQDTFDPAAGARCIAIDVTSIIRDEVLAPAVMDYFFHRIMRTVQERSAPWGVFVDETEPLVRASEAFRNQLRIILQEARRSRGLAVLAFQRPVAIRELGLEELILGQCKTLIFLRNPRAQWPEYEAFGLSPSEFQFIRGRGAAANRPYAVLIVKETPRGRESVGIDFDLRRLGGYRDVLRGGREVIERAVDAKLTHGEDWVEHFVDEAEAMR